MKNEVQLIMTLPGFQSKLEPAKFIHSHFNKELTALIICKDGDKALLYVEPPAKRYHVEDASYTYYFTYGILKQQGDYSKNILPIYRDGSETIRFIKAVED